MPTGRNAANSSARENIWNYSNKYPVDAMVFSVIMRKFVATYFVFQNPNPQFLSIRTNILLANPRNTYHCFSVIEINEDVAVRTGPIRSWLLPVSGAGRELVNSASYMNLLNCPGGLWMFYFSCRLFLKKLFTIIIVKYLFKRKSIFIVISHSPSPLSEPIYNFFKSWGGVGPPPWLALQWIWCVSSGRPTADSPSITALIRSWPYDWWRRNKLL